MTPYAIHNPYVVRYMLVQYKVRVAAISCHGLSMANPGSSTMLDTASNDGVMFVILWIGNLRERGGGYWVYIMDISIYTISMLHTR